MVGLLCYKQRAVTDGRLNIRRGKRVDFAAVLDLARRAGTFESVPESETGLARLFRRLVRDLGCDLYVAERGGEVQGVVMVSYRRLFVRGGLCALVDALLAGGQDGEIRERLFAFAKERARKKGCRVLQVQVGEPPAGEWKRLLADAGLTATGTWFSCSLA